MRSRLVLILVCALTALSGAATPAFAAKGHGASTTTTTTSSQARTVHHAKATTASKKKKKTTTGSASTAAATQILNDCQAHGQLTRDYSRADLKKALSIMSASTSQYSNCSDVIHTALTHGIKLSGTTGSGGSGSSTTTIVIIVVVVLLLLAAIFGGLVVRRRRGGGGSAGSGVSPPSTS